jgi:mono/diheme cytochrome c family protein
MHNWRVLTLVSILAWSVAVTSIAADGDVDQDAAGSTLGSAAQHPGAELYQAACATCHGPDGRGQPRSHVGFAVPIPDFTDCAFATPEPDADWLAVVHSGGPARAFDRRMPAFADALSEPQMRQILVHVRTFCGDRRWPRGELNLPRALVTEKAYPENEAVWTLTVSTGDARRVGTEWLYERRLGARSQFEVAVPVAFQQAGAGGWSRGLGDLAGALKHVVAHNLDRGSIVSIAGELILPTGRAPEGLGVGVTVFEPFIAFGQILPRDAFVQAQAGVELPFDRDRASAEAFWRVAAGKTFVQNRFGRAWAPMLEVLGSREIDGGARTDWDVVPQVQVTLNRRQHLMLNAGVRLPVTHRGSRAATVLTYLLWDWFDGSLRDGWK